jgi:hypothetical protein
MRRTNLPQVFLTILFSIAVLTTSAHAQATRTWVSGVGDDANPCSRTAPCKTFAGAISKTAAGGEINCIDPGGFGGVTITKAMMIDCSNTEAGVLVSGSNGITVSAGASDVVVLRGLDIIGTASVPALNGIRFVSGAALHVEKCTIREFLSGGTNRFGILFQPAATSELYVTESYITNNGSGSAGGGIMIRATGSGSAKVIIKNANVDNNITGITADGGSTTGDTTLTVRDSVSAGASFTGISVVTPAAGGGQSIIDIYNSSIFHNATGISSFGPKSVVVLSGSHVSGNGTALNAASSGQILTYQNNDLNTNGANGSFTGTLAPL